ncbi:MAG: hypothetical protein [Caudoviricetes sp.]|nr:MAG: hypothetical protein [Caudoviricetes sp.]
MKSFYAYLSETEKTYSYRMRTIVQLSETDIKKIKTILSKYDVCYFDGPRETIMQESPIDFPAYNMVNVHIIDFKTKIPASCYMIQEQIRKSLSINNSQIIIRGENDPTELQELSDEYNDLETSIGKPLLSTSPVYDEYNYDFDKDVQYYGDEYNQKLLTYLAALAAAKSDGVVDVQPENQKEKAFSWMNAKVDDGVFNDGHDGVTPVSKNNLSKKQIKKIKEPVEVSPYGNIDSTLRFGEFKRTKKEGNI